MHDASPGESEPKSTGAGLRSRWVWGPAAALGLVALGAGGALLLTRSTADGDDETPRVVAQYQVSSTRLPLFEERPHDRQRDELFRNTQTAYVKSPLVHMAALGYAGVAEVPLIKQQAEPLEWLREHLEVAFPSNGEILEISLPQSLGDPHELKQIVEAVSRAYYEQCVFRSRSEAMMPLQILKRSLRTVQEQLNVKRVTLAQMDADAGLDPESLARQTLARAEIESLRRERREINAELRAAEVAHALTQAGESTVATLGQEASEEAPTSKTAPPKTPVERAIGSERRLQAVRQVLTKALGRLDTEIQEREDSIVAASTPHEDLDALEREIAHFEAIEAELAGRVSRLQIEAQAPARILAIGPNAAGYAVAESAPYQPRLPR